MAKFRSEKKASEIRLVESENPRSWSLHTDEVFREGPKIRLPSGKLTWQWKIPFSNREYIFKRSIFHCHVSLPEGTAFLVAEEKRFQLQGVVPKCLKIVSVIVEGLVPCC